jgi:hypothetical protein
MAFVTESSASAKLQLLLGLLLALMSLCWNPDLIASAQAEEAGSRFCQGFLYCKETTGDTTFTQAFFYLYSTEDRGTYSRLTIRPFYARETDPARGYLRRSVLWPLGISEQKGDASYFQILPLYWQANDLVRRYTVVVPLYFDYAKGDRQYTHLIPLYGHHQRGDDYHRYFVLGPIAMATYDERTDLKEWDVLFPLFHYGRSLKGSATRIFPIYFSGNTSEDGSWYRNILPLYGRSVTPRGDLGYLFPFYGSFTDASTQERRTSAIGLPPLPGVDLPAVALYERASTPTSVKDRLFPLYTYQNDRSLSSSGWSLLGYGQFSLAGYGHSPDRTWHQLIPLYQATDDHTTQKENTNILGFGRFSLFRYWNTPEGLGHQLFPIYSYDHPSAEEWHWSAIFPAPISLYRHDHKGTATADRFYPIYDWARRGEARSLSLLGISDYAMFQQKSDPSQFAQRLFPLYGYKSAYENRTQLSLLGLAPRADAFAWSIYEHGRSPTYLLTRLSPLYRFERNDETKEVSWSALFLYRHMETETLLRDAFPPLHEYERNDDTGTTELSLLGIAPVTLFKRSTGPDERSSYLFPIYDHDRQGATSRLAMIGWPKVGILPTFSLFEKEDSPSLTAHRLFPVYRYRRNDEAKTRDWDAALLWWHRQTEFHLRDIFFPLTDVERDSETNSSRLSLIGFPKFGDFPALTLFSWEQSPSLNTHRFFPSYQYSYDQGEGIRAWSAFYLYWHHSDPTETRNTFFPLGSVKQKPSEEMWNVSVLGVAPLSMIEISKSSTRIQNRFTPLWDYHKEGSRRGLSLVGYRRMSLFSHEETADAGSDHLFPLWLRTKSPTESTLIIFPLWSSFEDRSTGERSLGVLGFGPGSLYYRKQSSAGISSRVFPAWSYQYEEATQESQTGVLGIPPISFYYGRNSPTATESRLFPLFRYSSDRIKEESEFWFLWPLFDHKAVQGRTTKTSFLWWLFEYRSPKADEWEYWVLGHRPIAAFMRTVTPTRTLVEINPIIPGWRREYVEGVGTSWALFGGLIGMDAMPDGTHKLRLFWVRMK